MTNLQIRKDHDIDFPYALEFESRQVELTEEGMLQLIEALEALVSARDDIHTEIALDMDLE